MKKSKTAKVIYGGAFIATNKQTNKIDQMHPVDDFWVSLLNSYYY